MKGLHAITHNFNADWVSEFAPVSVQKPLSYFVGAL